MKNKGIGMIQAVSRIGHVNNVGEMSTMVQLFMYEKTIIHSITHNLKAVTYWRQADTKELEKVQAKLLRMLLKLPEGAPYWGILNELGIWPLTAIVHYKRFMLYQNLITSDDERRAKRLIQYQKEFMIDGSWYEGLDIISKEYGINLNSNIIKTKSKWKTYVKSKIRAKLKTDSESKKNSMTKLRHQRKQEFCMQKYVNNTSITRIGDLLRVKLELLDVGKNQGHENRKCYCCNLENETTEHITSCSEVCEATQMDSIEWNEEMMSDRNHLQRMYQIIKRYIRIREKSEMINTQVE